jgi:hypothetical protein
MRKILLVAAGLALMAATTERGTKVIKAAPNQTTASTKLLKVQNAAAADVFTVDLEGDAVCRNLTVGGTFTLPSTDFAAGLTGTTAVLSGNSSVGGTFGVGNQNVLFTPAGAASFGIGSATVSAAGAAAFATSLAVGDQNFTVNAGGEAAAVALTVSGAAVLNGGLAMDTNKFTVANASGNTVIAGTLTQGAAISGATLAAIKGIMLFTSSSTDIAEIAAATATATDIELVGVAAGDVVILTGMGSAQDSGLICDARAKTNAITLTCYNVTAGAINPAGKVYSFLVLDVT